MPVSGGLLTQIAIGTVALYTLVTAASRAIGRLLVLVEYYVTVDKYSCGGHSPRLPYVSFPQPKSEASSFRSR